MRKTILFFKNLMGVLKRERNSQICFPSLSKTAILFVPGLIMPSSFAMVSVNQAPPVALVYEGPGACEDGCVDAAVEVAVQAGFSVRKVGPNAITPEMSAKAKKSIKRSIFKDAKVWVQPGGIANVAYVSMTPELQEAIVEFVKNGGGYVGYCAGAFMATDIIGETRNWGLGIFPGRAGVYRVATERGDVAFSLESVIWNGKPRVMYFEGGPYLYGFGNEVEVIATYENDYYQELVAAARANFGKGRVFVTGLHPEAPDDWTEESQIHDPDGNDQALAVQMMNWAAKRLER